MSVAQKAEESQGRSTESEPGGLPLGFQLGLGDWALLALGLTLLFGAVAYWVVALSA